MTPKSLPILQAAAAEKGFTVEFHKPVWVRQAENLKGGYWTSRFYSITGPAGFYAYCSKQAEVKSIING